MRETTIIFPARPTVSLERLTQLLRDIKLTSELEEYQLAGLITEQETLRLFLEHKEAYHAGRSILPA